MLFAMHRITNVLGFDEPAWMQIVGALRKNPLSTADLTIADDFEASALLIGGRPEDILKIRALSESIRARDVYAPLHDAHKESIDQWLSLSDDQIKASQFQALQFQAQNRGWEERLRQVEHLPSAERRTEMLRLSEEARAMRPTQTNSP